MFVSNPDSQKPGEYECIEVTLRYHSVLDKYRRSAYSSRHQAGRVVPSVCIVFGLAAKSDADGILLFATSRPAHSLHVNPHLESCRATQEVHAFIAELIFDLLS